MGIHVSARSGTIRCAARSFVDWPRRWWRRPSPGSGAPLRDSLARLLAGPEPPALAPRPCGGHARSSAVSVVPPKSTGDARTTGLFRDQPIPAILGVTQMNEEVAVMLLLV